MMARKLLSTIDAGELELRLLSEDDLQFTYAWRNRDDVRKWFKTSNKLSYSKHLDWFSRYLNDPNDCIYVVWNRRLNKRVGQVSIYNIDQSKGVAEVGRFIADPDSRGCGYIKKACLALISEAKKELSVIRIYLEVNASNYGAIKLYESLGFDVYKSDENYLYMNMGT